MNITVSGLDLAKNIFHFVGCNKAGKQIKKKMLRRSEVLSHFAQLPPCLVGMEACSSAHYWARCYQQCKNDPLQQLKSDPVQLTLVLLDKHHDFKRRVHENKNISQARDVSTRHC